jgi:hypothetical protein
METEGQQRKATKPVCRRIFELKGKTQKQIAKQISKEFKITVGQGFVSKVLAYDDYNLSTVC